MWDRHIPPAFNAFRPVAVDVGLMIIAIIGDCLIRPRFARLPGCAGGQKRELIMRGLRISVDARPVLAQHLHLASRQCR